MRDDIKMDNDQNLPGSSTLSQQPSGTPKHLCSNWPRMARTWSLTTSSSHIVLSSPLLYPSGIGHKNQICYPSRLHSMPHTTYGHDSSFSMPTPSTRGRTETFPFDHCKAFCSPACLWVCQKQLMMAGSFDIVNWVNTLYWFFFFLFLHCCSSTVVFIPSHH